MVKLEIVVALIVALEMLVVEMVTSPVNVTVLEDVNGPLKSEFPNTVIEDNEADAPTNGFVEVIGPLKSDLPKTVMEEESTPLVMARIVTVAGSKA